MHNILSKIIANKKEGVNQLKIIKPLSTLIKSEWFNKKSISAREALQKEKSSGIIAEFKRKSPSKGILNSNADITKIVSSYEKYKASICSILTDEKFFGAQKYDFYKARNCCNLPLLRKDFIIDKYQIYESKAMGADVILLIAAISSIKECNEFARIAKSLDLEVLLEIHTEEELTYLSPYIDLVGINNRNLRNFKVDLEKATNLGQKIPLSYTKIAESGLKNHEDIIQLKKCGFKGFLIGEQFMKSPNPGLTCKKLIEKLNEN